MLALIHFIVSQHIFNIIKYLLVLKKVGNNDKRDEVDKIFPDLYDFCNHFISTHIENF